MNTSQNTQLSALVQLMVQIKQLHPYFDAATIATLATNIQSESLFS